MRSPFGSVLFAGISLSSEIVFSNGVCGTFAVDSKGNTFRLVTLQMVCSLVLLFSPPSASVVLIS